MARKGQIAPFAGSFAPEGWAHCNGQNGNPFVPNLPCNGYKGEMSYIICTADSEEPLVGEIRTFTGDFAPPGWLLCQGQELKINDYTVFYSIFGKDYGGDGKTTFGIPKIADAKSLVGDGVCHYIICKEGSWPRRT